MEEVLLSMKFDTSFSISDIIAGLTFLSAIIAGIFALVQWNKNMKIKRAEYVKSLMVEMRSNDEIAIYLFDYNNQLWYDREFHNSNKLEKKIDYTLNFFSYICYLRKHRIIKDADFNCFRYTIVRILQNNQFQNYCYNLYHFSLRMKQRIPFYDLFIYGTKNHYFDDEFWNKKSKKYPHYLNF